MIYARYILTVIASVAIAPMAVIAPFIVSLFTRDGWPKWSSLFATYDNPPQGDIGYQFNRAPFTTTDDGIRGYLNRVVWMFRNPLYGFKKLASVQWSDDCELKFIGTDIISDKYQIPGYYFASCKRAFEFYGVFPYSSNRCIRCRLGWKILTPKFKDMGFAPFVFTINPFDSYGE